ncbi:uncharacterized protein TNCV_3467161 [Trichonephila clavipes]|nr:uncharacterized protein TNCV_3467161 [Trichonephila clavipes]
MACLPQRFLCKRLGTLKLTKIRWSREPAPRIWDEYFPRRMGEKLNHDEKNKSRILPRKRGGRTYPQAQAIYRSRTPAGRNLEDSGRETGRQKAINQEGDSSPQEHSLRKMLCDEANFVVRFGLAIHQNDHQARRRFVEWAQNEIAVIPDFHKRNLFSDEAHFWLNGYVNKQNYRIWSEANPQVYVETLLHPEKLTVWCALWAGGILLQKR